MCGIVGYVGPQNAASVILEGLQRLEYRGYDSAGIATIAEDDIHIRRSVGKLDHLRQTLQINPLAGSIGIGHTRWATHGAVIERNAHPHTSTYNDYVVVHNGIVENYRLLRDELSAQGICFRSDTDSEVIVHLVAQIAEQNPHYSLTEITRQAVMRLQGAHAIAVMSKHHPDQFVVVRIGNAGGVTLGLGKGEHFIASDIPALLNYTRDVVFMEDNQIATLSAGAYRLENLNGDRIIPQKHSIEWQQGQAEKGPYRHFMQKEIYEQGRSITDTLRGRVNFEQHHITLPELNLSTDQAQALQRIVTVACGTSYYSALVGKFYLEALAKIQVEVDYASEYRYRNPYLTANTALLAITQSGETVDTLAAIESAVEQNATIWSIVNNVGSQAMRIANGCIPMNTGPEIGVASTKAFTASIIDQYLLALYLAQHRKTLSPAALQAHIDDLARLPDLISKVLNAMAPLEALAEQFSTYKNFLYLGRGINYPIALEGALKLKEISYIHAEGYPAGEMKHGPIALIDEHMPVIVIALQDRLYDKMLSQVEQVKARGGKVIALATQGDTLIHSKADHVIELPAVSEWLSPVISVIPLQLFAYWVAVKTGADVDQPRNLAKSVTVE